MAHVIIRELVQGASVTSVELEQSLVNVHKYVIRDANGTTRHAAGGEAAIWRAGTNGEYAVKAFSMDSRGRAQREFNMLSKLHKNKYVPTVYGQGVLVEDDGVCHDAIVEEFVKGVSLGKALGDGLLTGDIKRRSLNAERAALIALELTRACRELHNVGILHRDISLTNTMLSEKCVQSDFQRGVDLRLVDFGSSTSTHCANNVSFEQEVKLAAIPFGAPELFCNVHCEALRFSDNLILPNRNSGGTDVWSIGAIITSLIYGEEYWPLKIEDIRRYGFGYTGDSAAELARITDAKTVPIELTSLLKHKRDLRNSDYRLADIVRNCTNPDPNLRPSLETLEASLLTLLARTHGTNG